MDTKIKKELACIIRQAYSQPKRGWHGLGHLRRMRPYLDGVLKLYPNCSAAILTAWLWHDFSYVPGAHVNEEMSIRRMRMVYKPGPDLDLAEWLIKATDVNAKGYTFDPYTVENANSRDESKLMCMFRQADWCGMNSISDMTPADMDLLEDWERGIRHEFGPNNRKYREGRLAFLRWALEHGMLSVPAVTFVSHLVHQPTKVAVYAGSFLPYHIGHDDIYRKACQVFDHVVVSRGRNPGKAGLDVTAWTRYGGVNREYGGMLIDHIREVSDEVGSPVALVRGLRDGFDLVKEFQLNEVLQDQAKERGMGPLSVVYIHGDRNLNHVSGEVVRSLPEDERRMYMPSSWSGSDAIKAFVDKHGQQDVEAIDIFAEGV